MSSIESTLSTLQNDTNRLRFQQGRDSLGETSLGPNAFLQLLMAQLQHQDPLNPVEDSEFLSQQAQFTQIEKLDDLIAATNGSNAIAQASTMVGQNVEVLLEGGETRSGRVDSVILGSDGAGLVIGDSVYDISQVTRVFADGINPEGSDSGDG